MPINDTEGKLLLAQLAEAERAVREHVFPRLIVQPHVDEDRETERDEDEEESHELICPVCDGVVYPDDLSAVDTAERWSTVSGDVDFDDERITFSGDDGADWSETLYYLHRDSHAVSMPEGWSEGWA